MAGKFPREAFLFNFVSCKERYAKRENYVFSYVFNVHMLTLQLLVNQECWTTNLGS